MVSRAERKKGRLAYYGQFACGKFAAERGEGGPRDERIADAQDTFDGQDAPLPYGPPGRRGPRQRDERP